MSDTIVHVYTGRAVTRAGSNTLNFGPMTAAEWPQSEQAAREYAGQTPPDQFPVTVQHTETTIACGMYTRGFCGHCHAGWPTRALVDDELIGRHVTDSYVITDPADIAS